MTNYYLGTIKKVIDELTYEVRVDIDGVVEDKPAFPLRGEVDEPRVGDMVILRNIDPLYGSMYLYSKLKEDEYIGFRSNGKSVNITPEYIEMSVYKKGDDSSSDYKDSYTRIKILDSGDIDIVVGNGANMNISIEGTADVKSNDTMTINSPEIIIKGPGTLKASGVVIPKAEGGPFCAMKVAPPVGTPMISGDTIILTE